MGTRFARILGMNWVKEQIEAQRKSRQRKSGEAAKRTAGRRGKQKEA